MRLAIILLIATLGSAETIQVTSSEVTAIGVAWSTSVTTHAVLVDGTHVSLYCQTWTGGDCVLLRQQTYEAEVDRKKGEVFILTQRSSKWSTHVPIRDEGKGKFHRVRYTIMGSW